MILYNSTNHPGPLNTFDGDVSIITESFDVLGCGVIMPQTHIVAVAELVDTKGGRVTGRLIFTQLYPSQKIIVIGIIYRLRFGSYSLHIEDAESGQRCKNGNTSIDLSEVNIT